MTLKADDVHVWLTFPEHSCDEAHLRRLKALLSADEVARRRRFVFEKDRHVFLVTRALVRTTLSRHAERPPEAWRSRAIRTGGPRSRALLRPLRSASTARTRRGSQRGDQRLARAQLERVVALRSAAGETDRISVNENGKGEASLGAAVSRLVPTSRILTRE
jgi:hypothetical protein